MSLLASFSDGSKRNFRSMRKRKFVDSDTHREPLPKRNRTQYPPSKPPTSRSIQDENRRRDDDARPETRTEISPSDPPSAPSVLDLFENIARLQNDRPIGSKLVSPARRFFKVKDWLEEAYPKHHICVVIGGSGSAKINDLVYLVEHSTRRAIVKDLALVKSKSELERTLTGIALYNHKSRSLIDDDVGHPPNRDVVFILHGFAVLNSKNVCDSSTWGRILNLAPSKGSGHKWRAIMVFNLDDDHRWVTGRHMKKIDRVFLSDLTSGQIFKWFKTHALPSLSRMLVETRTPSGIRTSVLQIFWTAATELGHQRDWSDIRSFLLHLHWELLGYSSMFELYSGTTRSTGEKSWTASEARHSHLGKDMRVNHLYQTCQRLLSSRVSLMSTQSVHDIFTHSEYCIQVLRENRYTFIDTSRQLSHLRAIDREARVESEISMMQYHIPAEVRLFLHACNWKANLSKFLYHDSVARERRVELGSYAKRSKLGTLDNRSLLRLRGLVGEFCLSELPMIPSRTRYDLKSDEVVAKPGIEKHMFIIGSKGSDQILGFRSNVDEMFNVKIEVVVGPVDDQDHPSSKSDIESLVLRLAVVKRGSKRVRKLSDFGEEAIVTKVRSVADQSASVKLYLDSTVYLRKGDGIAYDLDDEGGMTFDPEKRCTIDIKSFTVQASFPRLRTRKDLDGVYSKLERESLKIQREIKLFEKTKLSIQTIGASGHTDVGPRERMKGLHRYFNIQVKQKPPVSETKESDPLDIIKADLLARVEELEAKSDIDLIMSSKDTSTSATDCRPEELYWVHSIVENASSSVARHNLTHTLRMKNLKSVFLESEKSRNKK